MAKVILWAHIEYPMHANHALNLLDCIMRGDAMGELISHRWHDEYTSQHGTLSSLMRVMMSPEYFRAATASLHWDHG